MHAVIAAWYLGLGMRGNYESRNGMERGTERGTEVRCGRALDWTGLTQKYLLSILIYSLRSLA